MDLKSLVLKMRQDQVLKGKRPAVIKCLKNIGEVYKGPSRFFILSYKENKLHFQGLTKVFNRYNSKLDFDLLINDITKVEIVKSRFQDFVYIYLKDNKFILFIYYIDLKGTYESMVNARAIITYLKSKQIEVVGEYYNE